VFCAAIYSEVTNCCVNAVFPTPGPPSISTRKTGTSLALAAAAAAAAAAMTLSGCVGCAAWHLTMKSCTALGDMMLQVRVRRALGGGAADMVETRRSNDSASQPCIHAVWSNSVTSAVSSVGLVGKTTISSPSLTRPPLRVRENDLFQDNTISDLFIDSLIGIVS